MTKIKVIADQATLDEACGRLKNKPWLALDTEFMREKTFSPILCLIQVASDDETFCIDPLAIDNINSFGELLALSEQTKVLHSNRQDLEAFDTRLSQTINNLFDTQIAASFTGYGDQVSYAAMVEAVTEVKLAKSHTRANWAARPLSDSELTYALDDVHYLQTIREHLTEKLNSLGRMDWFTQECERQLHPDHWRLTPESAWVRLKGGAKLPIVAQETARQLAIWREREAIRRDRPREWVLSTRGLLEVSRLNPPSKGALQRIDGIDVGVMRISAEAILEICANTARDQSADALWTAPDMLTPDQKKQVKQVMAKIRTVAEELQMSPSLFANRSAVEKFVRGNSSLDLFRGWRHEVIGAEILKDHS